MSAGAGCAEAIYGRRATGRDRNGFRSPSYFPDFKIFLLTTMGLTLSNLKESMPSDVTVNDAILQPFSMARDSAESQRQLVIPVV
jgi:hypothetical protein